MATTAEKAAKLTEFVACADARVKGDEKGEAQILLDRNFQAFGWPGIKKLMQDARSASRTTQVVLRSLTSYRSPSLSSR